MKKEKRIKSIRKEDTEVLDATDELEQKTKLNLEMSKLEAEIQKLMTDNKDLEQKVKLAQAELINYRKRKDEEVRATLQYANQDLIKELIVIMDNFESALKIKGEITEDMNKFLTGFQLMYNNLKSILEKFGVEEINRVGEIFDPNLEQALVTDSILERNDEEVLEVLQKGYKLKGRVIRPASVKINQK